LLVEILFRNRYFGTPWTPYSGHALVISREHLMRLSIFHYGTFIWMIGTAWYGNTAKNKVQMASWEMRVIVQEVMLCLRQPERM
jgi:hypothetical protein